MEEYKETVKFNRGAEQSENTEEAGGELSRTEAAAESAEKSGRTETGIESSAPGDAETSKHSESKNTEGGDVYVYQNQADSRIEYTEVVGLDIPEEELFPDAEADAETEADHSLEKTEDGEAPPRDNKKNDTPQAASESDVSADNMKYGLPADHPEMGELKSRIEQRRKESRRKQRRFRTRFYIIVITVILLIAGFFFSISGVFTIDSIEIRGNSHYNTEEIINMAHASPGRNIIYNDGSDKIVGYLENNPYIKKASVTKKFPSTLVITVEERTERIAFRYDDDYLLMDEDGILLKKTRNEPTTTVVEGNIVNRIKLGEAIGTEDKELMKKTTDLIKAMIAADMYFVKIDMSDKKQVRAYIYETLVVRTEYEMLMENLKNGRLHQVVEKLFAEGIKRGTITFMDDGTASFMPII